MGWYLALILQVPRQFMPGRFHEVDFSECLQALACETTRTPPEALLTQATMGPSAETELLAAATPPRNDEQPQRRTHDGRARQRPKALWTAAASTAPCRYGTGLVVEFRLSEPT